MEAKRLNQNDGVGWENMNAEILCLILCRVSTSANEIVRTFSLVCKGWLGVVLGPCCWSDVDLEDVRTNNIDPVVKELVRRSQFTARRISACRLSNIGFDYVANCGRFLTVLQIPLSKITDDMVEKHAGSLVNLKELDISCCSRITSKGLSYFGKSCQSLTNLKRNLHLKSSSKLNESEAYAIADTMTSLCHLELADGCFGDRGLIAILTNCKSLTYLDIEGCENVSFAFDIEERYQRLLGLKSSSEGIWYTAESTESLSSGEDSDEESCVTSNVV